MALVAKADKDSKKLSYLKKIYSKKEEPKFEKKEFENTEPKANSIEKVDQKFNRKVILKDIAFMAIIILIASSGYIVARLMKY
jgi:hypothetical protein